MALRLGGTGPLTFRMPAVAGVFPEVLARVVGMLLAVRTAIGIFDQTGASLVSAGGLSHGLPPIFLERWLPLLMQHETRRGVP